MLFDLKIGIGDVFGGLIGGAVDILSLIPRAIVGIFDSLLGASKRGNWRTVHAQLRILIQKLPDQLKSGGKDVVLGTLHTLLSLIGNLSRHTRHVKVNVLIDIMDDFVSIIELLEDNVRNTGTLALLSNINIQLRVMMSDMQTSGLDHHRFIAAQKRLIVLLTAAFNGLKSGSSSGGFNDERGSLQNIFNFFELIIRTSNSRQSSSDIGNMLDQLSNVLDGLEMISSSKSSANIIHSIAISIDAMASLNSKQGFSSTELLSFINGIANRLNMVFDLRGISGAVKFVVSTGGSAQYLSQISILLKDLQMRIKENDMSSIRSIILKLGNCNQ